MTTLLLTTSGRRSGQPRTTPLIYGRAGEKYLIVGSRGGAPTHPGWYENLVANPVVRVQVMADRFKARARTATPAERPALWKTMAAIWPPYDEYQQRTAREIPVVILERTGRRLGDAPRPAGPSPRDGLQRALRRRGVDRRGSFIDYAGLNIKNFLAA